MAEDDIDRLARTFSRWHKYRPQYERYFAEQQRGERDVLVTAVGDEVVGYTTIVWKSGYTPFQQDDIPEIVDLNVITEYQRHGIGTALIHGAECFVSEHDKPVIGISVEQSLDYTAANNLYPKLGYIPDGRGITAHDNELHLTKALYPL